MIKRILLYFSAYIILVFLPYPFFKNSASFDSGKFLTEYYKFLSNAFIVSLIIIWVKKNQNDISEFINAKRKKDHFNEHVNHLKLLIQNNDLIEIKTKFSLLMDVIPDDIKNNQELYNQITKSSKFIQSFNIYNTESLSKLPEYKNLINLINKL